jgi:hypothetical protein
MIKTLFPVILIVLMLFSVASSQEGPDFLHADSVISMPGDTFMIHFNYSFNWWPITSMAVYWWPNPSFVVDTFSLQGGLLDTTAIEIDSLIVGDSFFLFLNCLIPPVSHDTLIISLKMHSQTNAAVRRYRTMFYSKIYDVDFMLDDTAWAVINIASAPFQQGDLDHNDVIDENDVVILLNYIYHGQSFASPIGIADINSDGLIDIVDILGLKGRVFK